MTKKVHPLDTVDRAMADMLKQPGCKGVIFGAVYESGGTVVIHNGNLRGLGNQLREAVTEATAKTVAATVKGRM